MRQALHVSKAPVIFSHSNVKSLVDVPRNVPDDVLDLVRVNNGLVMVSFINNFTIPFASSIRPNVSNVADHVDYIRARHNGSVAHIGIGADFEGEDVFAYDDYPADLEDISKYPVLFAELIRRGYSDEEVVAVLGGNLQRVMRDAERVARELSSEKAPPQNENRLILDETCRSDF